MSPQLAEVPAQSSCLCYLGPMVNMHLVSKPERLMLSKVVGGPYNYYKLSSTKLKGFLLVFK